MSSPAELAFASRRYLFKPYIFMPVDESFLIGSGFPDRALIGQLHAAELPQFLRHSAEDVILQHRFELERLEEARQAEVALHRTLGDFEL